MPGRSPLAALISLGLLLVFWLAMCGAMASYAGGSWLHPHATSHAFFENFWCDLLRDPAHNGRANGTSVVLATLGFTSIAAALLPYWVQLARLLPRTSARFVRLAGPISALATAAVALVPSDRFPGLHAPAVLTAGGLGFCCGSVCAVWALRHRQRVPLFALTSLLLLAAAGANLVLYVHASYFHGPNTIWLPAVQKLASLALTAWMVVGLATARAHAGEIASINPPTP